MHPLIQLAQNALEQAQQMEQLAQDNQWDELNQIQTAHSKTVYELMTAEIPPELSGDLRTILLEVKETNNRTMQLAETVKTGLVKEKKTLGQAAKMQKALDAFR
ncbi:hypothetical protein [uncultured Neptuniibacter sp.]|uniref:hypothetical protein n=1 Tax=uncultured Neptuniibacter sp. TaxID=502143 RepID=UPI00262B1DFD|nr:hypothetical protein [uncultured Neptuniibacter sp.]